ncbi:MAG TPA: SsrA-binding protein SmpB [Candidatus Paceibacterota bacterium]|nr:SsrA-binding protein SmpB [Candidatus Paceibacterota bacterium]HRZ34336.1 SsrA-binding protein SmpB [Candidatus Paceibacterota bacterium]
MANLLENRKAKFSYELMEQFEAGIELLGNEVKSIKNRRGNLLGSYVAIRGNEAFLIGAEVPAYQPKNVGENYEPKRPRKLLLKRREILKLTEYDNEKGLTLIPIAMYNKGRNIKLSFVVARGKKFRDKRETIKRREADREMHRSLKKLR